MSGKIFQSRKTVTERSTQVSRAESLIRKLNSALLCETFEGVRLRGSFQGTVIGPDLDSSDEHSLASLYAELGSEKFADFLLSEIKEVLRGYEKDYRLERKIIDDDEVSFYFVAVDEDKGSEEHLEFQYLIDDGLLVINFRLAYFSDSDGSTTDELSHYFHDWITLTCADELSRLIDSGLERMFRSRMFQGFLSHLVER